MYGRVMPVQRPWKSLLGRKSFLAFLWGELPLDVLAWLPFDSTFILPNCAVAPAESGP